MIGGLSLNSIDIVYNDCYCSISKFNLNFQVEIYYQEYPLKTYPPISKGIVKDEPDSDGEDGAECQVVGYPPLPHGSIKEE